MAVTIKDIAKMAGVSRSTVSRVLNNSGYVNENTKNKVLSVINELNYTPSAIAKSLSTSKTNTIGVIVPEIDNPFFGEMIKGISSLAAEEELSILLCDTNESAEKELKALDVLLHQRIEGIIITPCLAEDNRNMEKLLEIHKMGIPLVLTDGHIKYSGLNGVFIDHVEGAFKATETLIKEGHKNIAIITGNMKSRPSIDRLSGYKKALEHYGITVKEDNIFYGDYTYESAYDATKKILMAQERPTAIFVLSNIMMLGCIKALNEEKLRVPDDISVIGFDKIDALNILGMNISFVNGPTEELGETAIDMLMDLLRGKNRGIVKRITLSPQLVLKGSEKYKVEGI